MEDLIKRNRKLVVWWKRIVYTVMFNRIGYKPADAQTVLTHIRLQLTADSESWFLYKEVMQCLAVSFTWFSSSNSYVGVADAHLRGEKKNSKEENICLLGLAFSEQVFFSMRITAKIPNKVPFLRIFFWDTQKLHSDPS